MNYAPACQVTELFCRKPMPKYEGKEPSPLEKWATLSYCCRKSGGKKSWSCNSTGGPVQLLWTNNCKLPTPRRNTTLCLQGTVSNCVTQLYISTVPEVQINSIKYPQSFKKLTAFSIYIFSFKRWKFHQKMEYIKLEGSIQVKYTSEEKKISIILSKKVLRIFTSKSQAKKQTKPTIHVFVAVAFSMHQNVLTCRCLPLCVLLPKIFKSEVQVTYMAGAGRSSWAELGVLCTTFYSTLGTTEKAMSWPHQIRQ